MGIESTLLSLIQAQVQISRVGAPFDAGHVVGVELPITGGKKQLVITFADPGVSPKHLMQGELVTSGPAATTQANVIVVRPQAWSDFAARFVLLSVAYDFIEYEVESGVDLAGAYAGRVDSALVDKGEQFPVPTTTLKIGFFDLNGGTRTYADPAIILRLLAHYGASLLRLNAQLIAQHDSNAPLGLDRFLAHLQQADASPNQTTAAASPEYVPAYLALYHEYDQLQRDGLFDSLGPAVRSMYQSKLDDLISIRKTEADVLNANLQTLVEASPGGYLLTHLVDRHLYLVVAKEAETHVDIVPLGPKTGKGFRDIWSDADLNRELFTDFGVFCLFNGVFEKFHKTPSRIKYRVENTVTTPLLGDSPTVRFWYGQGSDNTLHFGRGQLPMDQNFATGVDNLIGFMVNGETIGDEDLDVADALNSGLAVGRPLFGKIVHNGVPYVFWLGRRDLHIHLDNIDPTTIASMQEMLDFAHSLGATDIMGMDASDSIGFIDRTRGVIIEPAITKHAFMTTALAFRRSTS